MANAILLPGVIRPAELAYAGLLEALGDAIDARAKELELYAGDEPPPGYSVDTEIEAILDATADVDRFHLCGYSGGGAISVAFAARHSERLLSLTLLETPWMGNESQGASERAVWAEIRRANELPPEQQLPRFIALQLAAGVEPPPPPPGPPPPWMAKRPAGIRALESAFDRHRFDLDALGSFSSPVLYVLGGRSNPDLYGSVAKRAGELFGDFTLRVYEERHHFDPPHLAEPEQLAADLRAHWQAAEADA